MSPKEALNPRRALWAELLRLVILVSAALAVTAPFLTGNIIGGVDARWYAYMLGDSVEQVRQGHFLVTVGQGPFAWNGSVHLYRSAPVYMAVGRVMDLFTLRHLNFFALQHLTVVASALAGTLGFYAAAVRIVPARRFAAMGFALLYLLTPSWLSAIVHSEAYMSYMAFAALPVVLYGNARTVLREDGRGTVILGAGLALVWMCHPPIACLSTLATVFVQCGLIVGRGVLSWWNLIKGAAAFGILGAYYFVSMSELPQLGETHAMRSEAFVILGIMLFLTGIGRFFVGNRSPGWAACAGAGALLVWSTSPIWMCWVTGTASVWIACVALGRLSGKVDLKRHGFVMLFLSALAGAAIAEAWVGREGIFTDAIHMLALNTAHVGSWFMPLATPADPYSIFQPGWGLGACFALGVLSLWGSRPLGAKLFFAASLGLVICFFRVPLASNFIVGRFPVNFTLMCGVPLDLRMAPVIASFTAMGGVVWLATSKHEGPTARVLVGCVLGALVLWSGFQSEHLRRHVRTATGTLDYTDRNLRTENAVLDAYAYLLLPIPTYFSHGKMDPVLESRLLDGSGNVLVGPMEDARAMEARGVERIARTAQRVPNSATWFQLGPVITVEPGEHKLLRFAFDPAIDCRGYLILVAEHSYREYHLPDSGLERGFGVGGLRTSVLSLWNSGTDAEHYKLLLSGELGNTVSPSGPPFGTLYVSALDASRLPIALRSFIPYRAHVSTATGGILETFRVSMPGYRATVDGSAVPVKASQNHLVTFPVPAGEHEVELSFVGSLRLRLAAALSGLGWLALLGSCAWGAALRGRTDTR